MDRRKLTTINKSENARITRDYYLYDKFTTPRSAGAVNNTPVDGVGGLRNATDTGNKMSISGGVLLSEQNGAGSVTDPILSYSGRARTLGLTMLGTMTAISGRARAYWAIASKNASSEGLLTPVPPSLLMVVSSSSATIGLATAGVAYQYAYVLRAAGVFLFIKGETEYPLWTLVWPSLLGTTATLYPTINAFLGSQSEDNIRVPKQTYIPVPLQSDGMSAATTDGLGNPENNGTAGNAYTDIGTWGVAAGVRSCSVLGGGGTGSSVLATPTRNVFIEANLTRAAGSVGIRARQADANNYIQCVHDGTNVVVSQVVAGSSTTLSTTAVAFSAGATMKFAADELTYRAFYNNTAAGSGVLPDTTSTNHGLVTNNIGNTFDNLVIWARSGYEELNYM